MIRTYLNSIRRTLLTLCLLATATMSWAVDVATVEELKTQIASANTDIKLTADISLTETLVIDRTTQLTIDLDGHNITANGFRAIHIKQGVVTIKSDTPVMISAEGSVPVDNSVIRLGDGSSEFSGTKNTVNLTLGENVTVSTTVETCYGITVFGGSTTETLTVNGIVKTTGRPAVAGNGNAWNAGTTIIIGEKAELTTTNEVALYHPQDGTLTVSGKVTGTGGIEIKAGKLEVTDKAKITATGTSLSHTPNNNDPSTSGYAIAIVENGQYAGVSEIKISKDATIVGPVAVLKDSENTTTQDVKFTGDMKMLVKVTTTEGGEEKSFGQYLSLELAMSQAPADAIITLLDNVEIASTVETSKGYTLDLNGKTLTSNGQRALWIKSGEVSIKSATTGGKIDVPTCSDASSILLGSNETAAVSLTVGANVTISASQSAGIMLDGANTTNSLTVNGGISTTDSPAITGTKGMAGTTTISIASGAQVSATNAVAIYQPQKGSLSVDGEVSGAGGIELKSGTLNVGEHATITATGTPTHEAQTDAPSSLGYAIAIVENTAYAPVDPAPAIAIHDNASITGPIAELQDSENSSFAPVYTGNAVSAKVAAIGNDEYFTLKDAVDIVPASGTVKFLRDLTLTSTLLMDKEKSYTLDLAGNILTGEGVAAIQIKNGNVTIENTGTEEKSITVTGTPAAAIILGDDAGNNRNVSLIIKENVTVDGSSTIGILLKGEKTSETLEVVGKVSATGHSAIVGDGATKQIHIASTGVVTASDAVVIYHPQSGNLVIDGSVIGTATETSKAAGAIEMKGGNLTVNSGATITAAGSTTHAASTTAPSTNGYAIALVENPNFPGVGKANISNGANVTGIIACVVDAENINVAEPNFTGDVIMVATANGNKYAKLDEAIAEVSTNGEVKLLDDLSLTGMLSIDKPIILNLDDYSLINSHESDYAIAISQDVVLKNGGIVSSKSGDPATYITNGGISITAGSVTLKQMTVNTGSVSLNVAGGTANVDNLSSFASSAANTVALSTGTLKLEGKVYNTSTGTYKHAVSGSGTAVLTIATTAIVSSTNGNGIDWQSTGALTIKGGKVMGEEAVYANAGDVTIKGGTFTGTDNALVIVNETAGSRTISVEHGTFIGGTDFPPIVSKGASKISGFVEGDYFSYPIDQTLCASGYTVSPNPKNNGLYYLMNEIVIYDGSDWNSPSDIAFPIGTAKYVRNSGMGANGTKFGTLCLPFSFNPAPSSGIPAGMTFYSVNRIVDDVLYLDQLTTTIDACTPVVFHFTSATTDFTIISTNATISPEDAKVANNLVGTFNKQEITDTGLLENIYYLNSDAFHQAKNSLTVPAFRAYIKFSSGSGARPDVLNICIDDEAEDLQSIMQESAEEIIFDLHGNRQDELKPGFNLVKMKDGRTIKVYVNK